MCVPENCKNNAFFKKENFKKKQKCWFCWNWAISSLLRSQRARAKWVARGCALVFPMQLIYNKELWSTNLCWVSWLRSTRGIAKDWLFMCRNLSDSGVSWQPLETAVIKPPTFLIRTTLLYILFKYRLLMKCLFIAFPVNTFSVKLICSVM